MNIKLPADWRNFDRLSGYKILMEDINKPEYYIAFIDYCLLSRVYFFFLLNIAYFIFLKPKHKATLSIKRRLSDACGVVAPNVRRPSIRTDLMIMRTKTCSLAAGNENIAPGSRITLRSSEPGKTCTIQW